MFLFFLTYTSVAHLPFPPLHASVTRYTQQRTCQLMSHVSLFFFSFSLFPFFGVFIYILFYFILVDWYLCQVLSLPVRICQPVFLSITILVSSCLVQLLSITIFLSVRMHPIFLSTLSLCLFFPLSLSLTTYIYFYLCQSARPSPASCHSYSCKQIFFYDSRPVDSKSHVVSARGGDVLESQRVLSGGSMGRRERLCYSWPTSLTITGVPFFCFPLTPIP